MMNLIQQIQMMNNDEFIALLKKQGACLESVAWCKQHGGNTAEMWRDCQRGDWLGWFIRKNARLLYVTDRQWAGALAEMVKETAPILSKYLSMYEDGKATHGEVMLAGYSFGLTETFSFPAGKWPVDNKGADIIRKHFPLFGD